MQRKKIKRTRDQSLDESDVTNISIATNIQNVSDLPSASSSLELQDVTRISETTASFSLKNCVLDAAVMEEIKNSTDLSTLGRFFPPPESFDFGLGERMKRRQERKQRRRERKESQSSSSSLNLTECTNNQPLNFKPHDCSVDLDFTNCSTNSNDTKIIPGIVFKKPDCTVDFSLGSNDSNTSESTIDNPLKFKPPDCTVDFSLGSSDSNTSESTIDNPLKFKPPDCTVDFSLGSSDSITSESTIDNPLKFKPPKCSVDFNLTDSDAMDITKPGIVFKKPNCTVDFSLSSHDLNTSESIDVLKFKPPKCSVNFNLTDDVTDDTGITKPGIVFKKPDCTVDFTLSSNNLNTSEAIDNPLKFKPPKCSVNLNLTDDIVFKNPDCDVEPLRECVNDNIEVQPRPDSRIQDLFEKLQSPRKSTSFSTSRDVRETDERENVAIGLEAKNIISPTKLNSTFVIETTDKTPQEAKNISPTKLNSTYVCEATETKQKLDSTFLISSNIKVDGTTNKKSNIPQAQIKNVNNSKTETEDVTNSGLKFNESNIAEAQLKEYSNSKTEIEDVNPDSTINKSNNAEAQFKNVNNSKTNNSGSAINEANIAEGQFKDVTNSKAETKVVNNSGSANNESKIAEAQINEIYDASKSEDNVEMEAEDQEDMTNITNSNSKQTDMESTTVELSLFMDVDSSDKELESSVSESKINESKIAEAQLKDVINSGSTNNESNIVEAQINEINDESKSEDNVEMEAEDQEDMANITNSNSKQTDMEDTTVELSLFMDIDSSVKELESSVSESKINSIETPMEVEVVNNGALPEVDIEKSPIEVKNSSNDIELKKGSKDNISVGNTITVSASPIADSQGPSKNSSTADLVDEEKAIENSSEVRGIEKLPIETKNSDQIEILELVDVAAVEPEVKKVPKKLERKVSFPNNYETLCEGSPNISIIPLDKSRRGPRETSTPIASRTRSSKRSVVDVHEKSFYDSHKSNLRKTKSRQAKSDLAPNISVASSIRVQDFPVAISQEPVVAGPSKESSSGDSSKLPTFSKSHILQITHISDSESETSEREEDVVIKVKKPKKINKKLYDSVFEEPVEKFKKPNKLSTRAPKRYKPAKWVTKELYNFLDEKLKNDFKLDYRKKAQEVVLLLFTAVKFSDFGSSSEEIDERFKTILRDNKICSTIFDYSMFCQTYLPLETRKKFLPLAGMYGTPKRNPTGKLYDPL